MACLLETLWSDLIGFCRLRTRNPISSFAIDNQFVIDDNGYGSSNNRKPQVCNPPLVHSLAWSPSGRSLAAGLGNGCIGIFAVGQNRNLVQTGLLSEGAHDSSVVSVVFPQFSAGDGNVNGSDERILCSAGSDGSILFWDLGPMLTGSGWENEWEETDAANEQSTTTESQDDDLAKMFAGSLSVNDDHHQGFAGSDKPRVLFRIPHGQKMNWVTRATTACSGSGSNRNDNNTFFVADTSEDITCYTIPMR